MTVAENKEEFESQVRKSMSEQRISFVSAVYRLVDRLSAEEIKRRQITLACKPGCCFCCYQLVSCTEIEWVEIKNLIPKIQGKAAQRLDKRLRQARREWSNYSQENAHLLENNLFKAYEGLGLLKAKEDWLFGRGPFKVYLDWLNKPCPFLNQKGFCDVYPVRPIDCRALTSTQTCTNWVQEGPNYSQFDWDKWASNLIFEEQGRRSSIKAIPFHQFLLHHWISTLQL